MAEQIVRTFDVYNTSVLLPGYTIPGRENEHSLSKAFYTTDFSSNPLGSKIDFFTQLNDPCIGVYNPNPVFDVNTSLSALDPNWFDQWWDEAMFYSHPIVLEQLKQNSPAAYQAFSDNVGSLTYNYADVDADGNVSTTSINPRLANKIPNKALSMINRLNALTQKDYNTYFAPTKSFGAGTKLQANQIKAFADTVKNVQSKINNSFSIVSGKLPFNRVSVGNLITPSNWNYKVKIESLQTAVDRLGNVINAPNRLIAEGINKAKGLFPKVYLPSMSKIAAALIPGGAAISKIATAAKQAASTVQAAVATAQGAIAAAKQVAATAVATADAVVKAGTAVVTTANTTVNAVKNTAQNLKNIASSVTNGNVTSAMVNQSKQTISDLTSNTVVVVNQGAKNASGNNATLAINTLKSSNKPPIA